MNGGAGLVVHGGAYSFNRLQLSHNAVGIRVIGSGSPAITASRITHNDVGLLAEQGATPSIAESDISANTQFGVRNTQPAAVVQARGNWWGHASGPKDAVGNPAGQGNAVSTGVDYGSYLSAEPVLACTMAPTQGYVTRVRNVELVLSARRQRSTAFKSRTSLARRWPGKPWPATPIQ